MLWMCHSTRARRTGCAAVVTLGKSFTIALTCAALLWNCATQVPEKKDVREESGWSYWAESRDTLGSRSWDYKLAYENLEVQLQARLTTPFGEMQLVAAEDQYSNSGWTMISETTSSSIPVVPPTITHEALRSGFYASDGSSKLQGTPESWVYLANVKEPGWVGPERLFDKGFLSQHPFLGHSKAGAETGSNR